MPDLDIVIQYNNRVCNRSGREQILIELIAARLGPTSPLVRFDQVRISNTLVVVLQQRLAVMFDDSVLKVTSEEANFDQ